MHGNDTNKGRRYRLQKSGRRLRALLWTLAGIVALVGAAIVWLFSTDLGAFKPRIEDFASERLGRRLGVDGALHISLGEELVVIAERARLENTDWAGVEPLLTVGRIELRVDLWSLISGPAIVRLVDIDGVAIRLARDEAQVGNWVLEGLVPDSTSSRQPPERAFDVLLQEVSIDDLSLTYSTPERPTPLNVVVQNLHQALRGDGFLDASLVGSINGRNAAVDGRVGTWAALLRGKDVDFDLSAHLDELTITADGHVDDLLRPGRPSLNFSITGPDLREIRQMFGLGDEGSGGVDVEGRLTPEDGGPLILSLTGKAGISQIEARGSFANLRDFQDIDIEIRASGPDLGELLRVAQIDHARDAPFEIDIDAERHGLTVEIGRANMQFAQSTLEISARMPQFPSLEDATLRIDLQGSDLERFRRLTGLPGAATGPFSLGFEVTEGGGERELGHLEFRTDLIELSASGELGPPPRHVGTKLNFNIRTEDLARVGGAWQVPNLPARPVAAGGGIEILADGIRIIEPVVVRMDGVTARLTGTVRTEAWLAGSTLDFEVDGPDLAGLVNAFYPVSRIPALGFVATGKLAMEPGVMVFRNASAELGTTTLDIDGRLALNRGIEGSRFAVAARGPAFEELVRDIADLDVRPGDFRLSGNFAVTPDAFAFSSVSLERAFAEADLDISIGRRPDVPRLAFDARASGRDVRVLLRRLDAYSADEAPFTADARGEWNDGHLAIDRLDVSVGDARASAQGTLDYGDASAESRLELQASIPDLASLGSLDGRRFGSQPLTWRSTITGGNGQLDISDLDATIGTSRITGSVSYKAGAVPVLDVNLVSPSLVLLPLLEPEGETGVPVTAEEEPPSPDARVIPDVAVPFDAMRKLDGSLRVRIGELRRGMLELTDVETDATLGAGVLEISRFGFGARSGRLDGQARIDPADGKGKASLRMSARQLALGLHPSNRDLQFSGDLDVDLESAGTNLRSIAANANGVIFLDSRGGRFENSSLGSLYFGSFLQELFATLNPFVKTEPYTSLDCMIIPLEITGGSASTVPNSLIRTNKIEIATHGRVNLANEKLDISVRTVPRKGIVMSAAELVNPYFKVGGTLARPVMAVDEQGVLITGGAAVATGGISIIAKAVWDRISRAPDPCTDTAARARKELGTRWPYLLEHPPSAVK